VELGDYLMITGGCVVVVTSSTMIGGLMVIGILGQNTVGGQGLSVVVVDVVTVGWP
jgi:hypothetical protein